nr:PEP-CTERM sorting domain-containing protein [uncultured Desulfobacter sp.]
MFKFKLVLGSICILLFGLLMSNMAQAALTTIGTASYNGDEYNLIWSYDEDSGNSVVWLDYTNSYESWADQLDWAAGLGDCLTINLYDGYTVTWDDDEWRLPSAGVNPSVGSASTSAEMIYLYYVELGLTKGWDKEDEVNATIFKNLEITQYWLAEECTIYGTNSAWSFTMYDGTLGYGLPTLNYAAMALRSGKVSVVPVPGSAWLFGIGLLGLTGLRRKKYSNKV